MLVNLEDLLYEYRERFDENFPVMLFRGTPEDELIETVRKCLEDGRPFEPDLEDEADY